MTRVVGRYATFLLREHYTHLRSIDTCRDATLQQVDEKDQSDAVCDSRLLSRAVDRLTRTV